MSTRVAIDIGPRCHGCNKKLAEEVARPWTIRCPRCKQDSTGDRHGQPHETRIVEQTD